MGGLTIGEETINLKSHASSLNGKSHKNRIRINYTQIQVLQKMWNIFRKILLERHCRIKEQERFLEASNPAKQSRKFKIASQIGQENVAWKSNDLYWLTLPLNLPSLLRKLYPSFSNCLVSTKVRVPAYFPKIPELSIFYNKFPLQPTDKWPVIKVIVKNNQNIH